MKRVILQGRAALLSMYKLIHRNLLATAESEQRTDLRESRRRQEDRQGRIFRHRDRLEEARQHEDD